MKRKSFALILTSLIVFACLSNPLSAQEKVGNQGDKEAAEALKNALLTYDFSEFSSLLSDECTLVVADFGSISESDSIVSFLRKFCQNDLRPKSKSSPAVVTTLYNFTSALWISYFDDGSKFGKWLDYYILFRMEHGLIADMYLAESESSIINRREFSEVEYFFPDKMFPNAYYWPMQLPYSLSEFELDSSNRIEARANAMPCMECGLKSERLEWHHVKRFARLAPNIDAADDYAYFDGEVSVCPHCGHIVQHLESEDYTHCDAKDLVTNAPNIDTVSIVTNNDFAKKGIIFQTLIRQINDEWEKDKVVSKTKVDEIMDRLDALHFPDEVNLHIRLPFGPEVGSEKYRIINGTQSELRICINGEQQTSYYGNVYADTTSMGAWQLFLLSNANRILPIEDERFESQDFVFCKMQLLAKQQMKNRDFSNLLKKYPLEPQITMSKCVIGGEMKHVADIQCCFWKERTGVVIEKGRIVMGADGCFERYIALEQNFLHCYNKSAFRNPLPEQVFMPSCDNSAAEALGYALSTYDFSFFSTYLTESTTLTVDDKCCLIGENNIVSYLRKLCKDSTLPDAEQLGIPYFSVMISPYNYKKALCAHVWDDSVLEKTWWDFHQKYMLFKMKDGKIADMVLADGYACSRPESYPDRDSHLWAQQLPFSLGSLEFDDREGIEAQANALPCMKCGLKSEKLDWYPARRFDYYDEENDSCSFVLGSISICPHCGSLVQWIEDTLVQCKVKNPKEYLMKNDTETKSIGNIFSRKGADYLDAIGQINEKWKDNESIPQSVLDNLMKQLDALHYPKDGKLDFCIQGVDGEEDVPVLINANFELRVRVDGKSMPSLYGNVYADTTCMGAWQLFLLANAVHVLPFIWHGGYESYDYVFCEKDLYGLRELVGRDIPKLIENYPIEPKISLSRKKVGGETKIFADIYCCHWNDWEGLALDHYRVIMSEDGCFERIFTMDQTILHHYNCGMMY